MTTHHHSPASIPSQQPVPAGKCTHRIRCSALPGELQIVSAGLHRNHEADGVVVNGPIPYVEQIRFDACKRKEAKNATMKIKMNILVQELSSVGRRRHHQGAAQEHSREKYIKNKFIMIKLGDGVKWEIFAGEGVGWHGSSFISRLLFFELLQAR